MADVLGGFQPDTKSPSARRADFDLRRRIAELERNGNGGPAPEPDPDPTNWNSSWGVVAQSASRLEIAEPLTFSAGGAYLSHPVAFTTVVGRRYRTVAHIRAISPDSQSFFLAWTDGWNVNAGIEGASISNWVHPTGPGVYGGHTSEWLFDGDGVTYNWAVLADTVLGGSIKLHHHASKFYVEDVGPVSGSTPIPDPTPAWLPMPSLANGWTAYGGAEMPPAYRKIGDMVQVRGSIKNATPMANPSVSTFVTLPVGCRPPHTTVLACMGVGSDGYGCAGVIVAEYNGQLRAVCSATNFWPYVQTQFDTQFSVTP